MANKTRYDIKYCAECKQNTRHLVEYAETVAADGSKTSFDLSSTCQSH